MRTGGLRTYAIKGVAGIGEGTRIMPGLVVVRPGSVHIGRNCVVMNGFLMMGAGGITIEDGGHALYGNSYAK